MEIGFAKIVISIITLLEKHAKNVKEIKQQILEFSQTTGNVPSAISQISVKMILVKIVERKKKLVTRDSNMIFLKT